MTSKRRVSCWKEWVRRLYLFECGPRGPAFFGFNGGRASVLLKLKALGNGLVGILIGMRPDTCAAKNHRTSSRS